MHCWLLNAHNLGNNLVVSPASRAVIVFHVPWDSFIPGVKMFFVYLNDENCNEEPSRVWSMIMTYILFGELHTKLCTCNFKHESVHPFQMENRLAYNLYKFMTQFVGHKLYNNEYIKKNTFIRRKYINSQQLNCLLSLLLQWLEAQ